MTGLNVDPPLQGEVAAAQWLTEGCHAIERGTPPPPRAARAVPLPLWGEDRKIPALGEWSVA